jgi:hypothetical protein
MDQKNLFKEYEEIFKEAEETSSSKDKKERIFDYSPFALQDALGEKNVKKAWIEYEKLRLDGILAEDLIHKVVGKIRDMAAINKGATKEDLGLKDYPYSKSKRDLKNWKEKDLENFHTKLVDIYHQSRMGGDDLDIAIEKVFLNLL